MVKDVIKKKSGTSCVSIWPEDWMGKAYTCTAWFVGVFIPLIVMIGLYSRVIYALWFKGNDGNQHTQQQKVSLILLREFTHASQRKSPLPPTKISSLRTDAWTKIPWPVNKKLYLAKRQVFRLRVGFPLFAFFCKTTTEDFVLFQNWYLAGGWTKNSKPLIRNRILVPDSFPKWPTSTHVLFMRESSLLVFSYLNTQLTARSRVYLTIKIKVALLIRFYITISIGFDSSKYMPSWSDLYFFTNRVSWRCASASPWWW